MHDDAGNTKHHGGHRVPNFIPVLISVPLMAERPPPPSPLACRGSVEHAHALAYIAKTKRSNKTIE